MWDDPIIDEIHKTREKILEENNYDLDKIYQKINENVDKLKDKNWKFVTKNEILKR